MTQVSPMASPASMAQALGMLRSAMAYLSAADATQMAAETQAQCLHALEQADAMSTAARASILGAFTSGQGYYADADRSAGGWLIHKTRITKAAAMAHTAWTRRAAAHPEVAHALAQGNVVSESIARSICKWTDKLPGDCRDAADAILVGAAKAGMDQQDLARLAFEMIDRSRPQQPDQDEDETFEDRALRLEATFDGAAILHGDLTPECAAVVTSVLDSLSAPRGAEDTRSHAQRYHDALHEAMTRLIASGTLPERAGQPVKAWVHVTLGDLMMLEGSSALLDQWISRVRGQWAGHRAAAAVGAGDGAAWLDGDAAAAMTCDASAAPVVMGVVDLVALDDLVGLCVELARVQDAEATQASEAAPVDQVASPTLSVREALERAIIGKAVDLLSGPGGLASYLRRSQLGARLGGPSLPLDVGVSDTVPAGIRNAILLRDQRCRWAGGCNQPAAACQVHHTRHKKDGGKTSVRDCVLLCWFHHQVMIHRMGWTLVLNADGTTSAWNRDKTKVLRSHSPPPRPG